MRRGRGFGLAMILLLIVGGPVLGADAEAKTRARPLILVHYMPWYESKGISGKWGWHWTMSHFDPERSDPSGRREIASHEYPMIGLYDSADPDVLEYHTLLMKVAGIDGAIADWYGSEDVNDYAMIQRRTAAVFESLARRGLKFAVCYEDRVLKVMAERSKWTSAQAVEHGLIHLRSCAANWFRNPAYVQWEGKPLLLVFGPDYLKPAQWETVLDGLQPIPAFFTLHERRPPALGCFAWPPMWASKDGVLDAKALDTYLDRFSRQEGPKIPCAFPGFHDIYQEAGTQLSHGYLDARQGETFRQTLGRALASGSPLIQVATWNDFGEGTCIEPTRESGYRALDTVQEVRRKSSADPFPYRADDLRLPLRIYELRKRVAPTGPGRKALDEAAGFLFAAESRHAAQRIAEVEQTAPARPQ